MNLHQAITAVNSKFQYTPDPKFLFDIWKIIEEDKDGKLKGDCEDYSLTVIWYANDCSLLKFIWNTIFTRKYKLHHVTTVNNVPHVIGSYDDMYFDNWTMKAMYKVDFFKSTQHRYDYTYFLPLMVFSFITGFIFKRIN